MIRAQPELTELGLVCSRKSKPTESKTYMVSEELSLLVRSRVEIDGHLATVRYMGEVPPTKGTWLGVEWDDPTRGKHDGSHEGVRYFHTSAPNSGSFIRPKKANTGVSFWSAAQERYGEIEDESAGVITEDMFVLGKNQQQTVVQIVGAKKVNKAQSKFDQLTKLGLCGKYISCAGDASAIRENFPKVTELDISANLLPDWETVASITAALHKLDTLNVSGTPLTYPENNADIKAAFAMVNTLFMNRMKYDWQDVKQVVTLFERLETLHCCWNQIQAIDVITPNLANLKFLNLESNPLTSWENALVFGQLQHLEILLLNDCALSTIHFLDVPHGKKSSHFPRLQQLALNHNKLTQWTVFDELNKLCCLNNLRVQHNPVTEPTDETSDSTIRYNIIAKMEHLRLLNRTQVDGAERKGAEVDYRKVYGLLWKEAGGHQDAALNKPSASFTALHPRFQQLIEKYGSPEDSELKVQSSALKNTLISVNICCPNLLDQRVITKRLPGSMIVQKLKVLVQRLLRVDPREEIMLTYMTEKMPDKEVELDSEQKQLCYYSMEDGDTVCARW